MPRTIPFLLILAGVLTAFACNSAQPPKTPTTPAVTTPTESPRSAQAVAEIEKHGGTVKRQDGTPHGPVVEVHLYGNTVTDLTLQQLKGLHQLQTLTLSGTAITDDGLDDLRGMNHLQTLNLSGTRVTDAGLVYLQGFTQLQQLYLGDTQVTGTRLDQLQGLHNLQRLGLNGTPITDEAARGL